MAPSNCLLLLFFFFFFFFFFFEYRGASSAVDQSRDAKALLQFKAVVAEQDPRGLLLSSWGRPDNPYPCPPSSSNSSLLPSSWYGVGCSGLYGRVASLRLPRAGLTVPAHRLFSALDGAEQLLELDLSFNGLTGNLSTAAQQPCPPLFSHLHSLYLSSNRLYGSISQLDSNIPSVSPCLGAIHDLDLSYNNFSGPLPVFAECPPALRRLDLSSNRLSGPVPPLSSCSGLQILNLSSNALSGSIPEQFGDLCSNLTTLDLSSNSLTATIPSAMAACSSLHFLSLANNHLSGPLPSLLLSSLSSLESLYLGSNGFYGSLPDLSSNFSRWVKVLDLSSNKLSGPIIPSQICPPSSLLEQLSLQNNGLYGGFPAGLADCRKLRILGLSFNNLTGSLPSELSQLNQLESLSIWNNGLVGAIPPEYGKLGKLRNLILNDNYLSGDIPIELMNCTKLEWLSLTNNHLTGTIPSAIARMSELTLVQLGKNFLRGEIPPELGNCSKLLWFDANSNELSGVLTPSLFTGSHALYKSTLDGDVFAFVRNMDSSCRGTGILLDFSGLVADSLALLRRSCSASRLYIGSTLSANPDFTSIQFLDLSYNQLSGTIPAEIGRTRALTILDLSHNSFTGGIPITFAQLKNLGVLDLSDNRLTGGIWPLENCTFLVQFDLSNNLLSGTIPQTGQLGTAPASAYANNPGLCGEPLPPCTSTISGSPLNCSANPRLCSKRTTAFSKVTTTILSILGSLAAVLCVGGVALAVWHRKGAKRRQIKEQTLLDSMQSSCNGSSSSWNFSGERREPLSINVATFERPLVRKLTFSHLVEATDGFSRESLIGRGGFGEVYRAHLKDGSLVAIKKLVQCSCQGDREFMAEMETLGKIKHRNLVPLLGYCKIGEERLLVYDFMEGGSLDEVLHREEKLDWQQRKRIAKGAARGLSFLHHNCVPHIIHRDMKSSNVLLDKDMEARVSDFGMARLINAFDTHLSVSTLAGTPGYVPPEYYQSFRCTAKGDVYSFGVVLLELLTGKKPTYSKEDGDEGDDNSNLVGWVKLHVKQKKERDVLDPALQDEDYVEMLHYLRIACNCLDDLSSRRPTMLQVVAMFKDYDMPSQSCSSTSSSSLSSQQSIAVLNHTQLSISTSAHSPQGDVHGLLVASANTT